MKRLALLLSWLLSTSLFANPVVDNIAGGDVSIQQTPDTTTINQTSQKAIINWSSFNIGANEHTHFQQPAGGVALNRISPSQGPSSIYGRLSATGRIILINPAGVFFGPHSFINVGSIIATTAGLSDQDFLNNNYHFNQISPNMGEIINQGTIIAAEHGLVALMGNGVRNDGYIEAKMGKVILASAEKFTMSFAGNDLISFTVDGEAQKGVKNSGTIIADGGTVMVHAKVAENILDHAINMDGYVQANTVQQVGGEIIFSAGNNGSVRIAGRLKAAGILPDDVGGIVVLAGNNILLDSGASIDVSGPAGGGQIIIGGHYPSSTGPPLQIASTIKMMPDVNLYADALTHGNGGSVILWANDVAQAFGFVSAHGGPQGGNGGFIETSAALLNVNYMKVDLHTVLGMVGTWLLDPADITISLNPNSNISGTDYLTSSSQVTNSILNIQTLLNALATSNVVVEATNNIIVSDAISWSSASTLFLKAANRIFINAPVTALSGALELLAASLPRSITTNYAGSIHVDTFTLKQGQWYQVLQPLPAFAATHLVLNTGTSFVRVDSNNVAQVVDQPMYSARDKKVVITPPPARLDITLPTYKDCLQFAINGKEVSSCR